MALLINGEYVDDSIIREEAKMLRPHMAESMEGMDPLEFEAKVREWSRENVIERILLKQQALADPEPLPPEAIDKVLAEARQNNGEGCAVTPSNEEVIRQDIELRLRTERVIEKVSAKVPPPRYKLVGEYYKKNREQFKQPEMIRVAHIVKNVDGNTTEEAALEAIRKAEEELRNGADFAEVADRYSDCAGRGGDLGYFPRGEMVEEFDDVVFALEINQTSGIFRTGFGYHIARLYDRKPEAIRDLADVRQDIENELHRQKKQEAVEKFLDGLREKADIQEVARRGA
jgi:hypothetical protein